MEPYDIEEAFAAIEEELIASMMRNMKRHKVEESAEEMRWEMWQAKQLQALEKYKKQNQKKFQGKFADINGSVDEIIHKARKQGGLDQEIEIMNAIKKGWKPPGSLNKSMQTTGEFFKLNDRKLNALIGATRKDFSKAEHAMLRMADDQYRKIIFNAQVYANTGAGTYEKAVDMATKDFLGSGINCIEYKNGARHKISDYAFMAIQTASKRAYLTGEGEKRQEWGISTVIVNKRGNPCPKCLPFVGKILVDDVWSGGKPSDGKYPLMSTAIAAGLYHPRCKDSHTTYFPGISTADDTWTKQELEAVEKVNKQEVKQQYVERQVEKYKRLTKYSLDNDNQKMYETRSKDWSDKVDEVDFLDRIKAFFNPASIDIMEDFEMSLHDVKNKDTRVLLKQSKARVKFNKSKKKKSYYTKGVIYIAENATPSTIAHELFHEIDHTYGLTQNGALTLQIQNDYKRLLQLSSNYGKSIEDMLYLKYPEVFENGRRGIKLQEEFRGISDILNGMSRGKIRLGYRHQDDYWLKPLKLEKETWAQYGRMIYQSDERVLEFMEILFPETTTEVYRMLKEMIK